MMNSDRQESVTAALAAAAVVAQSAMEHTRLEEEKLRVQTKGKKDQSKNTVSSLFSVSNLIKLIANSNLGANASPEVKTHLKSFLHRKLQKEGKLQ